MSGLQLPVTRTVAPLASVAVTASAPVATTVAGPTAPVEASTVSLTEPATVTSDKYTWCDFKLAGGSIAIILMTAIGILIWGMTTLSEEKKKKKNDLIIVTNVLAGITMVLLCCLLIAILLCDPSYDKKINILLGFISFFYIATYSVYLYLCWG